MKNKKDKLINKGTLQFVLFFIIGILFLHIIRECSIRRQSPPPSIINLNAWIVQDDKKEYIYSSGLNHKIYILNTISLYCFFGCKCSIDNIIKLYDKINSENKNIVYFITIILASDTKIKKKIIEYMNQEQISRKNWKTISILNKYQKKSLKKKENKSFLNKKYNKISHEIGFVLFSNKSIRGFFPNNIRGLSELDRSVNLLNKKNILT